MRKVEPGVPLGRYIDDNEGVDVDLTCLGCMKQRILPMAGVVRRLAALGRDPRMVGIKEIAGLVKEPCERCGDVSYETRPWRPIGPGMGQRVE